MDTPDAGLPEGDDRRKKFVAKGILETLDVRILHFPGFLLSFSTHLSTFREYK